MSTATTVVDHKEDDLAERPGSRRRLVLLLALLAVAALIAGQLLLAGDKDVAAITSANDRQSFILTGEGGIVEVSTSVSAGGVAIQHQDLSPLDSKLHYVLWMITTEPTRPIRIGALDRSGDGSTSWRVQTALATGFAVTVETREEPERPTGPTILSGW